MGSLLRASCAVFVLCVWGFAQSQVTASAQLSVVVNLEVSLAWHGDSAVIVKIRLKPGMYVAVWADESCGAPSANSQVIPISGTYTIPLGRIGGLGKANICLSSSEGGIRLSLSGGDGRPNIFR